MHQVGVNHTDLNIHNILIDDKDRVWIIDFDKCRFETSGDWKHQNLDRLKRSFEKELKSKNIIWSKTDFDELVSAVVNF